MDEDLKRLIEDRQKNAETPNHVDTIAADLRRQFGVQIRVKLVASINEHFAQLTRDMKNEFAEMNAMLRFSFSDLDQRLSSLEERVDRLESSRTQQLLAP